MYGSIYELDDPSGGSHGVVMPSPSNPNDLYPISREDWNGAKHTRNMGAILGGLLGAGAGTMGGIAFGDKPWYQSSPSFGTVAKSGITGGLLGALLGAGLGVRRGVHRLTDPNRFHISLGSSEGGVPRSSDPPAIEDVRYR